MQARFMRLPVGACAGLVFAIVLGSVAAAQTGPDSAVADASAEPVTVWRQERLLGDAGGLRPRLEAVGISFGLQDINEVWGNASGGRRRTVTYDGLTMLSLGVDTKAAFGWDGGIFNVSGLQIRGRSLATDATSALQTNSGINSRGTTRLWEAWYQQTFADGMADLKLGQQSLDLEFMTSQGSGLFLNTMMGWPMLPSANLYAGGPAYPLSSLGVRLRARPMEDVTLLAGVFQDNPPGGPFDNDSPLRGSTRWGANVNLRTGALVIAEAQYAINQPVTGDAGEARPAAGLPGTYKLGFWYDSAAFPSPRYDNTGMPLASPDSTGIARMLRPNWSVYGVADQAIWKPDPEGAWLLGVFVRAMAGPGDRNLISFSLNGGLTLKAPLPDREDDSVGIGVGVARVGAAARGYDRDLNRIDGPYPIRGTETFLELTYQVAVAPWWQIQPDFQYVFMPGGGIPNPSRPGKRIGNEAIFGLRSTMTF